jgi:hypothetical protein
MAEAAHANTGIPMPKSQCISKRNIFWIQKILLLLEKSVHMHEILQVLDMVGS